MIKNVANGNFWALFKVYGSAIVDLIENKKLAIPETLSFEIHRLSTMREDYDRLVF